MTVRHLELLGLKAKCKVTGYEGVIESLSYDLYGCVQAALRPPAHSKDGETKLGDGRWFDVKRVEILDRTPVMGVPDFTKPEIGAADKPAR